ncbi:hypothetical protein [Sinorhizobium psoraleae]|uniref:Uncharacterized protein n=1 Tax=Sinorhizobium psoraleae TaxID=520838 RepID=A0ABT4KSA0_9HYPH|nr:hypothetical protein [Sinorhizobium psoraleae]MCZ4094704.1 hypothetical protein [Sinorhizobium psoraleae]
MREGTLIVNGDQSAATGATTVEAGGVLGGIGTVGGDVSVLDNGALNPGDVGSAPGTLTINGNLTLAANATLNYNFGQAGVVGGAYNDLTVVHGNLTLDGAVNVGDARGNFGPGIYRIISYDGTLTDLGLTENSPNHIVQTSVAGQVNLVDISDLTLNYWDGDAVALHNNDLVNGGDGTWRAAGDDNWTNDTGHINAAFSMGASRFSPARQVRSASTARRMARSRPRGMQFATDGYTIQGESIELVGPQSIIRVGDGTLPGAGYTATITSVLSGDSNW